MQQLKIEMIHDIVCSWCPIGYSNIQKALRNLEIEADFHFLPYEINPEMGPTGEAIDAYFKRRNQWDKSMLHDYRKNLQAVAETAAVTIDFSNRTHYYNSQNAHKLMHWAESFNKQQAFNKLLIDAYFKRGLDISNTEILLQLIQQLGLDKSQAQQALTSDFISQQLQIKTQRVQQLELSSVPAFIINEHTLISGSNTPQYFEQLFISLINNDSPHLASAH